jgi:uncharacterized membrane protein SirB2
MIPVSPLDAVNWFIAFVSLSVVWFVMRDISRRLGEALRMRKYYVLYDLCEALLIVSIVMLFAHFVLGFRMPGGGMDLFPLGAKAMFVIAAVVDLAVTIKYWGWIVPEVLALRKK